MLTSDRVLFVCLLHQRELLLGQLFCPCDEDLVRLASDKDDSFPGQVINALHLSERDAKVALLQPCLA